jgi:arsenate reductase
MKILFMCVANSARSQLAEGLAKQLFGSNAEVQSAGSHSAVVNLFAIRVLKEVGIDISKHTSKSVDDLPPEFVTHLDYIVTLCAEEVCPIMVSKAKRLHWPLPDPARKGSNEEELLAMFRQTRDSIKVRLVEFELAVKGS